jgi:hypothetical protein
LPQLVAIYYPRSFLMPAADRDEEGTVFDSEVQSRLEARLRETNLGALLAARGVTTVAMNEQGELTEYRPDGTSAPVLDQPTAG